MAATYSAGRIGVLLVIALAALLTLLWFNQVERGEPEAPAPGSGISVRVWAVSGSDTLIDERVTVPEPATALAALETAAGRRQVALGIRDYDFGRLVVSIGGVTAGPSGDWTYRVNDSMPPVGAGALRLRDGDHVAFRFGAPAPDSL